MRGSGRRISQSANGTMTRSNISITSVMACCTRAVSLSPPTCAPNSVSETIASVRRFISRARSSGAPARQRSRVACAACVMASA
jgi:hypothetical protein